MQVVAYTKVNLNLEVLCRRKDGYHQVRTVLHTVDLVDRLAFEPSDVISLFCTDLPAKTEHNLVMRAARLLHQYTGCTSGVAIVLEKGIPVASGLGGGSSDAAATLKALNAFWELGLPSVTLFELGSRLGADVPFFLRGGCALAEGRGEVVTSLLPMRDWWAVISCPTFQLHDKTAHMYGLLTAKDFTDGSATKLLAHRLQAGIASSKAVMEGTNVFERVAATAFPGLEGYRTAMLDAGSPFVRLTGSGPALFTVVQRQEDGIAIVQRLRDAGREAYLARFVGSGES